MHVEKGDTFWNPFVQPEICTFFCHSCVDEFISSFLFSSDRFFILFIFWLSQVAKQWDALKTAEWNVEKKQHNCDCESKYVKKSTSSQRNGMWKLCSLIGIGIIQWEAVCDFVCMCREFSLKWYRELCHLKTIFSLFLCSMSLLLFAPVLFFSVTPSFYVSHKNIYRCEI